MVENRRVDDILSGVQPAPVVANADAKEIPEAIDASNESDKPKGQDALAETEYEGLDVEAESQEESDVAKDTSANRTDEYGNSLPKSKTYTEEEVNEMVRERLKRTHAPQDHKNVATPAEEGEPNWEQELESVVEKTLHKVSQKKQQQEMQEKEREIQMEFESKFTQGMGRFGDFEKIVKGKPITNHMMLATRSMKDPSAFIYAASKMQPKELERIAQLDPISQMAEIGRLDERMKKARSGSHAPAPLSTTRGDIPNKTKERGSVDQLILQDANKKLRRK